MNFTNYIASTFIYAVKNLLEFLSESNSTLPPPPPLYKARYDNAQVWRTALRSPDDIDAIESYRNNRYISIWKLTTKHADFLVLKNNKKAMRKAINALGLNYSVLIPDVQRVIDATRSRESPWTTNSLRLGHRLNFKNYPSLEIIEEYYAYLHNNFPLIASIRNIGYSSENRPLKMITISNGAPNNKRVLITGGQHAREWVGITTVLYMVNEIVTKFDTQPQYIRDIDWYIIPVVNPDGYEFTRTEDRLWRKTRRSIGECRGVDTNRNFITSFKVSDCSETYSGPHPFSEPETIAIKDVFKSMGAKIPALVLDIHSYGQFLIHPWGLATEPSPHLTQLRDCLALMQTAIVKTSSRFYKYGTPREMVQYPVTGCGMDWFHTEGVILSLVIEARDTGGKGFLLPPDEIEDTGKECWAALKAVTASLNSIDTTRSVFF